MSAQDPTAHSQPNPIPATPTLSAVSGRVGVSDVHRIEAAARAFRSLDYQYGGGSCRHAVLDDLFWAHQLLGAAAKDPVADLLYTAVADLHDVAGWTLFDTGLAKGALQHFAWALELAGQGGNDALAANVLYRTGRIYLHYDAPRRALETFEQGQESARTCGSPLALAILSINQAWAHARMGTADQALKLLGRATEEFARADLATAPPWAKFFGMADLSAMVGTVHTDLAQTAHVRHTQLAIPALSEAVATYPQDMTRSRALCLTMLATNHLLAGDVDDAARVADQAMELTGNLKSTRTKDRFQPLVQAANTHPGNPAASALAERITTFTASRPGCGWATDMLVSQPCKPTCVAPCPVVWNPNVPTAPAA